jgi:hypothetical protein
LLTLDKDTVCGWLPRLGEHCNRVMSYFFRNLHLSECQLDELWTFIYKKEDRLTPLEQLLGVYGDTWVWIAFSPVFKLVPAWVIGKRTLRDARRLIFRLKSATDGHIPFFTSDDLPHYADALLDAYGLTVRPRRRGKRGRRPLPRKRPPLTCAMPSWSKSVNGVGWCASPHASYMAAKNRSPGCSTLHPSARRSAPTG